MKTEKQPTLSELELEAIRGGISGPTANCRDSGNCGSDGNIEMNPPPPGCDDPQATC